MRSVVDDQQREETPPEAVQAWDSVRRVREPLAWTLLALAAIGLVISAWELFGLPGAPVIGAGGPVRETTFAYRAAAEAPGFVAVGIIALPVLAVILVAFAGGLTDRARQVVRTAVWIQVVALGLGVLSLLGALGLRSLPGIWFIADTRDIAFAAAALVFTAAVSRSQPLRPPDLQFQDLEDDDDIREED
jgi:hypothetical protein